MRHFLACLALCVTASLKASTPTISIDEFIANEMSATGIPGVAYAVVRDGQITAGQRGVSTFGNNDQIAETTPFMIGSISKSFTALGVMQLVEAGKVELDTPVSDYLPDFENKPSGTITIRQLLSHTSGYSTLQGNATQTDYSMDADALKRRVEGLAQTTPANAPDTKWEYSNANYMILGRMIEVVTGLDYADYIETSILAPAGMTDSFVHKQENEGRLASGHQPWFGSKRPLRTNMTGRGSGPQGGLAASARDLSRYLGLMMNGEDDILSAEGKSIMMQPASRVSPNYGFGWFINTEKGIVFHSGSNPGYEALATMVPSEKKGVAVLVNAGSGTGFGDTNHLRYGTSARAIDLEYDGSGPGIASKATFIALLVAPAIFLLGMIWAWLKRERIGAKKGAAGVFSVWFPLLMTGIQAWVILGVVPSMFGAPMTAIKAFQPDIALAMIATAVTGIAWAVWRIALHYMYRGARAKA